MAEATVRPRDNFDALRLGAAALVIVGHGYVLTGKGHPPSILGLRIDALGLAIFFSLSGYMIVQSWDRLGNLPRFLWHRALRIFPALWVLLLVTVFVVGPLVSVAGFMNYFTTGKPFSYLFGTAVLAAQYDLTGVFEVGRGALGHHSVSAVNGSLWTLGVEFSCYVAVALFAILLGRWRLIGFIGLAATAGMATYWDAGTAGLQAVENAGTVVAYFAVGAIAGLLRSKIPISALSVAALAVAWTVAALAMPDFTQVFAWAALPFLVVMVGRLSTPVLSRVARFGDFSYGLYLWGFLVQQVVVDRLGVLPLLPNALVVLSITGVLAALSWRFVEAPALSLKNWHVPVRVTRAASPADQLTMAR